MRYLLVDAHSVIFAWQELHELHQRNGLAAREELTRRLTAYQDATDVRVVVVFDGKGVRANAEKNPVGFRFSFRAEVRRRTKSSSGSWRSMRVSTK